MMYAIVCQVRAAQCYTMSVQATPLEDRLYYQELSARYYECARLALLGVAN